MLELADILHKICSQDWKSGLTRLEHPFFWIICFSADGAPLSRRGGPSGRPSPARPAPAARSRSPALTVPPGGSAGQRAEGPRGPSGGARSRGAGQRRDTGCLQAGDISPPAPSFLPLPPATSPLSPGLAGVPPRRGFWDIVGGAGWEEKGEAARENTKSGLKRRTRTDESAGGRRLQIPAGSAPAPRPPSEGGKRVRARAGWNAGLLGPHLPAGRGGAAAAGGRGRPADPELSAGCEDLNPLLRCGRPIMHRKHLQEIPDTNSNVNFTFSWGWDLHKTSDLLSGMGVAVLEKEKADAENIPQELLLTPAPPPKKQKVKAKEKDFVIARRPRQAKENSSGISWDMLPDELLLGIFSYLSLPDLIRISGICKRWHRLSFDESLWQTLDLTGKHLLPGVVGQLLSVGVVAFRCPRSHVDEPLFKNLRPLRVQHMDLSNCLIDEAALQSIVSRCCKLQNLSLEGLRLSDAIVRNLAQNSDLVRLNLSGCSGFSASALGTLLNSCTSLDELNLSWCSDFTAEHIQVAVSSVTESVTQLNLSGYRQNLQRSDVTTLVGRCPSLVHLDLSDSVLLKTDCFQEFHQLTYLQHLSLSRCYEIMPAALLELGEIPSLKTLQVFGIVTENSLPVLKEALPHLKINCSHFTTIARPTVGNKKNPEIWGIRCRLMMPNPNSH